MSCGCAARQTRPILSATIGATERKLAVPEGRLTFRTDVFAAVGSAFLSIDGGATLVPFCAEAPITLDVPARAEVVVVSAAAGVVVVVTE